MKHPLIQFLLLTCEQIKIDHEDPLEAHRFRWGSIDTKRAAFEQRKGHSFGRHKNPPSVVSRPCSLLLRQPFVDPTSLASFRPRVFPKAQKNVPVAR